MPRSCLFRVFSYFISGAAVDEAMGYSKGPGAAEPYPIEDAKRDFPTIMAMGVFFGPDGRDAFFDAGIDALLDWFEKSWPLSNPRSRRHDRRNSPEVQSKTKPQRMLANEEE